MKFVKNKMQNVSLVKLELANPNQTIAKLLVVLKIIRKLIGLDHLF